MEDLSHVRDVIAARADLARRIPASTYRVQLRPEFDFDAAARIAPYLAELGIDTLYASPHFRSAPGSTHGYDVIDPTVLNEELGGEAAYERLHSALRAHGIGLLIDIVPNHMGISGGSNRYWQDVLENGRTSPFAAYFDIDWEVVKPEQHGKVLLPILGEFYGVVLENGELQLTFDDGRFTLWYYETPLPIAPSTYGSILRVAQEQLDTLAELPELSALEFASIAAAFERLPSNHVTEVDLIEERRREQIVTSRRLAQLALDEPAVMSAIDHARSLFNGVHGQPESFNLLDELLEEQSYRLAFWRVAAEEINYRRFFAINELAAIRQELPEVFAATHGLVAKLIANGTIDGVRIDHIDGLWNPAEYLRELQRLAYLSRARAAVADDERWEAIEPEFAASLRERWSEIPVAPELSPLYIVVEKILQPNEQLPTDWPIAGTTGYEFGRITTQLFVDPSAERLFTQAYAGFTGRDEPLAAITAEAKRLILQEALSSELNVLAAALDRLSERRRRTRDFTLNNLRFALQEIIASFPIYRTYISDDGIVTQEDRRTIDAAIAAAIKRNPSSDRSAFGFVRDMLVGGEFEATTDDERERVRFAMRFQQLSGPVMAKGLEDTAFYRHYRLTALNEVGGDPATFGIDTGEFHRQIAQQPLKFRQGLLASTTHDTKRSEDVRARIVTLTEFPREWRAAVNRWSRLNRKHRTRTAGGSAPTKNDETLFYQTLAGFWPGGEARAEFDSAIERIVAFLQKAAREAQEETSWMNPNPEYEAALDRFARRVLDPEISGAFLDDFSAFNQDVMRAGAFTSLSMQLLKLTCPGVPDIYQGTESIELSLVDPDNRRLVDFEQRSVRLSEVRSLPAAQVQSLATQPEDGQLKLYLTTRLLHARRTHRELMSLGDYRPLAVTGELEKHVVAFERRYGDESMIVVVPRLIRQLVRRFGDDWCSAEAWQHTTVRLPDDIPEAKFVNPLIDANAAFEAGGALPVGELLRGFPVACWIAEAPMEAPA